MARNRLTLLDLVQRVLSAMNHDSVNSISDTVESQQIADEARNVYYDLMDRADWPHLIDLMPLEALGNTSKPNFLKIPEDVVRIDDVRYEVTLSGITNRHFDSITYLSPQEFLDQIIPRNTDNTNVDVITNDNGVPLFIINDERPHWWTSFDDEEIVFDSYDSAVDTTLQASKSLILAKKIPTWTNSDTFIPDMPDQMFSTFVAEVTASAFTYWKQGASVKDEQRAARGVSNLRKDARKHNERDTRAKYGRQRPHIVRSEDGDRGSIRESLSRF